MGVCDAELDVMDNYTLIFKERIGDDNGFLIDLEKTWHQLMKRLMIQVWLIVYFWLEVYSDGIDYDADQEPVTFAYLSVAGIDEDNVQIGKRENGEMQNH